MAVLDAVLVERFMFVFFKGWRDLDPLPLSTGKGYLVTIDGTGSKPSHRCALFARTAGARRLKILSGPKPKGSKMIPDAVIGGLSESR